MPSQLEQEHDHQPGVTGLVSGIIHDAQDLARQQLTLFQVEIKNDLHRTLAATIPIIVGLLVCLLAGIILAVGAAHLLPAIWPRLELWHGFAIVGGALALIGAILVGAGIAKFKKFSILPDQTLEGLKENIQWQTKK